MWCSEGGESYSYGKYACQGHLAFELLRMQNLQFRNFSYGSLLHYTHLSILIYLFFCFFVFLIQKTGSIHLTLLLCDLEVNCDIVNFKKWQLQWIN